MLATGWTCRVVPIASSRSASAAAFSARSMTSGTSDWPKEIVSLFRMPPQSRQCGIVFAGAHPGQRLLHRRPPAALPAHHPAHAAVHLDHQRRRLAGALVQLVDVLGDERMQLAALLERHQRAVAGVRRRAPGRRIEARAPRGLAHLRLGEVVLDRRLLLGRRVPRPHAARAAEIGNARFGRDAGAGERRRRAAAPSSRRRASSIGSIALRLRLAPRLSSSRPAAPGSPGSPASTCPA